MNAEDKIFSILGRYVFEASIQQERITAQEEEITRLKEIINKKKKKG